MNIWQKIITISNNRAKKIDPVFAKFCELAESKDSEYEIEAHQIIASGQLSKNIGAYVINYFIKENQIGFEIFEGGKPNEILAGNYGQIGETQEEIIFDLKSNLAQSEALALSYKAST